MPFHSRAVRNLAWISGAIIAMTAVGPQAHGDPSEPMSAVAALAECGITPESLVLADAEEAAATILNQINIQTQLRQLLTEKKAEMTEAVAAVSEIAQIMSQSGSNPALAAQLVAAEQTLQARQAELTSVRSAVFDTATSQLAPQAVNLLMHCIESASFTVPTSFRVLGRSPEQWKAIEGAIRIEARAVRRGAVVPAEVAQALSEIRTHADVLAAELRLATHLSAVEQIFAQAAHPES